MSHWDKYSRAYLIGFVFFIVTVGNAIGGEFANITDAQVAAMTKFRWFMSIVSIVVAVGTNLLAFLNQSVAGKPTSIKSADGTPQPVPPPAQ